MEKIAEPRVQGKFPNDSRAWFSKKHDRRQVRQFFFSSAIALARRTWTFSRLLQPAKPHMVPCKEETWLRRSNPERTDTLSHRSSCRRSPVPSRRPGVHPQPEWRITFLFLCAIWIEFPIRKGEDGECLSQRDRRKVVRRKPKAMAMAQRIARGATKIARAVVDEVEGSQGTRAFLTGILKRGLAAEAGDLKKTVLHDFHVENGAKMVPFAGWSMPIQYKDSIMESTQWCRSNASLFDVAHMCGLSLKGKDAIAFLEKLVVGDVKSLKPGTGTLSVFTNENGGIIDDSVITKVNDDHIYLVVNAGCRDKDLAHIEKHLKAFQGQGGDVNMHVHDERSLLALQGPEAANILQKYVKEDLGSMYFSDFKMIDVDGAPCWVTRTGYTGEDGFELSIPDENTLQIAKAFLSSDKVRLTGLGARDSLRLEAGLCLYGNDLEEHISPVEAGLTWTIGKSRREKCDFLGGETIKKHLTDGVPQRRVGLVSEKGAPPRSHAQIALEDGTVVGEVTSGAFSPNLKKNVAMGYVEKAHAKAGTKLSVLVRGKSNDAVVTKMPFVPAKYYKP